MTVRHISEDLYDKITRKIHGGYLDLDWGVVGSDGEPVDPPIVRPGLYIVAENYYGRAVLFVEPDMRLTECVQED